MRQKLDLPYEVALLYAKKGNFQRVACELEQKTGLPWTTIQVKRLLVKYLREQFHIRIEAGRPFERP